MSSKTERAIIEDPNLPAAIGRFIDHAAGDLDARVVVFDRVARAARAEREALLEVLALEVVKERHLSARTSQSDLTMMTQENETLRRRLRSATAKPALAVYAE